MGIFSFAVHFTSEECCRFHFKEQRDKEGVTCNRCGEKDHYWLKNKWAYQCKSCESRQNLRSGTIIENSNRSFMIMVQDILLDERHQKKVFQVKKSSDSWCLSVMNQYGQWFIR